MGVYVWIEWGGGDFEPSLPRLPMFVGEITAAEIVPVADYELRQILPPADDEVSVATLDQYPRWSEPGLALAARLIDRSDAQFLAQPVELPLRISLAIGPTPVTARIAEQATLLSLEGILAAAFSSGGRHVQACVPASVAHLPIRLAVLEVIRYAMGWQTPLGPMPAPLSDVPVRQAADGSGFVRLDDVPPHPRFHLGRRLRLTDDVETVPAQDWFRFIGQSSLPGASDTVSLH
jgi:hypothetical protein